VLTVSRLVGEAAMACGVDAVVGQLHGMSQRGGSVQSTVLLGAGQTSFIGAGQADVVLGLEPLEVLRALPTMRADTRVVTSTGRLVPHTLTQQGRDYPEVESMLDQIGQRVGEVIELDGPALAAAAGAARTLNIVMLGALAGVGTLPEAIGDGALLAALESRCPPRFLESNRRAFALGKEIVRGS
jgi:indolepyruvate ferredoxin oxidoreductase beta subunit